jgi:hypothetical protein
MTLSQFQPVEPKPATIAELVLAIEGYRNQLDIFAQSTLCNLEFLRDSLTARLAAIK